MSALLFDLFAFDLDGVLVDTSRCHALAYAELWRAAGIAGPGYEEVAGRRTAEVVAEATRPLAPSAAQLQAWVALKQEAARRCLEGPGLAFADVAPALAELAARGARLVLGTGASRATAETVLARTGLRGAFENVMTAEDVARGKPHPDTWARLMAEAHVRPERTLVIEDAESGLEAAHAAGAHLACVRSGLTHPSPRFFGSYPGLAALLLALERG